ncbi:Hypothetical predicted protein [Olea europaea subsp. europaea]|uniref:Uncharacterized protein n=1 Tax=Olea europaea subsp. europaea TaxID=158383 RepID=A0A8S0SWU8_OLEEU|nr:Hypothetical predicted protein [Olea europaea subsp. europaea]
MESSASTSCSMPMPALDSGLDTEPPVCLTCTGRLDQQEEKKEKKKKKKGDGRRRKGKKEEESVYCLQAEEWKEKESYSRRKKITFAKNRGGGMWVLFSLCGVRWRLRRERYGVVCYAFGLSLPSFP